MTLQPILVVWNVAVPYLGIQFSALWILSPIRVTAHR